MKQYYTITALARLAGVTVKTLRVYENKGLLVLERGKGNNYRIYSMQDVRRLEQIQIMKYLGFSLEQIENFLACHETIGHEEFLLAQKSMLEKKREQLDQVIACVEKATLECEESRMESDEFLNSLGKL